MLVPTVWKMWTRRPSIHLTCNEFCVNEPNLFDEFTIIGAMVYMFFEDVQSYRF